MAKMSCPKQLIIFLIELAMIAFATGALHAQGFVNAQLPWHQAVVDSKGKLLAWYHPEENLGYDKVLRLGWDFLENKVPNDPQTGLKVYLINSVFNPKTLLGIYWQHNPAMVYGSMVDSLVAWYPYSGDEQSKSVVRSMLDYQMAHGTTPTGWNWPSVPFATSCGNQPEYGRCIQDMPHEFYGGIETDKVGELGIGYVLFYEMTGERKYLEAGIHCADALAAHVRPGDADHTPWPFRVDARTGAVLDGEEYGGIIASSLRLFDELARLKEGNVAAYVKARDMAWKWVLDNPLNKGSKSWDKWSGYFEDVSKNTENLNQQAPDYTAYYILSRPDPAADDPLWMEHVGHLIDWVRHYLGLGPFLGAWAINEQRPPDTLHGPVNGCCSRAGDGSATGRWAAINALYYAKTGDLQARRDAFRSLNYATYYAASDGEISCCGTDYGSDGYWWSDGYADYLRHFNWVMGAVPEWAPVHQNHLLHSSSVVQKVVYGTESIEYKTFDAASTEVLHLSFKPQIVRAGGLVLAERRDLRQQGYTVEALHGGDYVLRVRHFGSGDIAIRGKAGVGR
ncbi:MAG TPA: hypothetical protein VFC10_13245 [Terriglobia bacterium]|nr:hypothetical protein [Terriglobia bacterium]